MSLLETRSASDEDASSRGGRRARGVFGTVPIAIAGSLAVTLSLVTPAHADQPRAETLGPEEKAPRTGSTTSLIPAATTASDARTVVADAPATYRVQSGDTVSSIAARFGLSTASVLAVNGLSWKSLIFPGQVLALPGHAASSAPVAATPAPVAPAPGQEATKYAVASGDTISRIAARFGVTTDAVLTVNGLGRGSLIFPGQKIIIPGMVTAALATPRPVAAAPAAPAAPVAPAPIAPPAGAVVVLTDEMRANAEIIVQVGRQAGVDDHGLVVALAAAAQESGLRNVQHGDRDSLGLFQQRPSTGWGTRDQILDPHFAARAFFGGPGNPNTGRTRGLLDIPGWQSMTVTQAAQAVQISAYPGAYGTWEPSARAWLSQLG